MCTVRIGSAGSETDERAGRGELVSGLLYFLCLGSTEIHSHFKRKSKGQNLEKRVCGLAELKSSDCVGFRKSQRKKNCHSAQLFAQNIRAQNKKVPDFSELQ